MSPGYVICALFFCISTDDLEETECTLRKFVHDTKLEGVVDMSVGRI